MTSDGWGVKLGLLEGGGGYFALYDSKHSVADSPRDTVGSLSVELIASSLAGNGYVAAGEHCQVKT